MGNRGSAATSPRRQSSPENTRRNQRTAVAYPRDRTTGRYLARERPAAAASPRSSAVEYRPRGKRASLSLKAVEYKQRSQSRIVKPAARSAASPSRRRVAVEVITAPRSEVDIERGTRKVRRYSRKCASPKIEVETPNEPQSSPPRRKGRAQSPRVSFTRPEKPAAPVAVQGSPILRSNYTSTPEKEKPTRSRSASPGQRSAAPPVKPVAAPSTSRRDYASPSLACQADAPATGNRRVQQRTSRKTESAAAADVEAVIGPATARQMKRMSTTPECELNTSALPAVERMAHSAAVANPTDLLFSYLNAP